MNPPSPRGQPHPASPPPGQRAPPAKPGPNGPPAKPKKKNPNPPPRRKYLRQYVRWLWPYRWTLLGVFLLALITAALDLVWPLAIKQIMDGVLLNPHHSATRKLALLNLYAGSVFAVLLLKQGVDSLRSFR